MIDDYFQLQDNGIILYNGLSTINKKRNWLAINPLLCKYLNLTYNNKEGSFRWDDKKGNKIVESIYWQVHSTDNYSRNHDSETGYGWYVLLYKEGYSMFKNLVEDKELFHHRKISRSMEYNSNRHREEIYESFANSLSQKIIL